MKRYIFFYWYAIIFVPNVISLSAQRKAPFWKWSNLSNCIFWWGFNKVTAAHQVTSNTLGLKSFHTFTGSSYIYLGCKDFWAQVYNNFLKAVHFVQCSCFLWSSSSNFEASFSNYFIDPYQRDQKCNYFNYKFSSLQFWPNQFEGKKFVKREEDPHNLNFKRQWKPYNKLHFESVLPTLSIFDFYFFSPFQNCK